MKTKNLLRLAFTLVAGTALVSTCPVKAVAAPAQAKKDEPTLEETMKWICGKILSDGGCRSGDESERYTECTFDGENKTLTVVYKYFVGDELLKEDTTIFPLNKISLNSIVRTLHYSYCVEMASYNGEKVIKKTVRGFGRWEHNPKYNKYDVDSEGNIVFPSEEMTDRMVKAFKRAVQLCGGTEEAF